VSGLDGHPLNLEDSGSRPPSGAARAEMSRRASGARATRCSLEQREVTDDPPDGRTEDRPWRGKTPREYRRRLGKPRGRTDTSTEESPEGREIAASQRADGSRSTARRRDMSTYTAPTRWPLRSRDRAARPSGRPHTVRLRDAREARAMWVRHRTPQHTDGRDAGALPRGDPRRESPSGLNRQEPPHTVARRRADSLTQAV